MDSELTKESIGKLYGKYLIPSLGGALATSVYSFVDTIAVGQACGPDGAAAIAVINPYFALMCFLGMLFGIGGSVLMSHAKGEGKPERADRLFTLSVLLLCITIAISWILSAIFLDEILIFSGADDALLPYARSYILPIVVSFPLFAINTFLAPVVRYDEKPQLVLKAVLIGGCFNIFGDWFLVFPMNLDMFGAGLATALGALIQTAILLSHFVFRHSSRYGNAPSWKLFDSIAVRRRSDVQVPRCFADYEISIAESAIPAEVSLVVMILRILMII